MAVAIDGKVTSQTLGAHVREKEGPDQHAKNEFTPVDQQGHTWRLCGNQKKRKKGEKKT